MPLYVAALVVGAVVGLMAPGTAPVLAVVIDPLIILLLYVTFLGVPFTTLWAGLGDLRFLVTVGVVNFVVVPLLVLLLSRVVADDAVLLVGVAFVLLAPCIDYVIAFTGLAGGARDRLLAATPLLMLAQLALLPGYVPLVVGPGLATAVEPQPFLRAFLVLVLAPLAAAVVTQLWSRNRPRNKAEEVGSAAMVPLILGALAVVVAAHVHGVAEHLGRLVRVLPVYLGFAVAMVAVGVLAGRLARLDVPARRAVVFSGVTRNSLVILPLVLALPAGYELVPLVVVTQTLVELLVMVALVRVVPRLLPEPGA
ncbi:arsenic resistance protein [Tessaracoccus terricola]